MALAFTMASGLRQSGLGLGLESSDHGLESPCLGLSLRILALTTSLLVLFLCY